MEVIHSYSPGSVAAAWITGFTLIRPSCVQRPVTHRSPTRVMTRAGGPLVKRALVRARRPELQSPKPSHQRPVGARPDFAGEGTDAATRCRNPRVFGRVQPHRLGRGGEAAQCGARHRGRSVV